jgi:hypothetical protein
MKAALIAALVAGLALTGCDRGQQVVADQQLKITRLRNLADARCMCLMNDETDKRCNFDYDDERKGLAATPRPETDFAVSGRGACFPSLDGQCVTEGYYLRGGGPLDHVCLEDDAYRLNEFHEKVMRESGGDQVAADAAAKARIKEIRAAWRAR